MKRYEALAEALAESMAAGQLRPGDLLFFGPKGSWHVAVYLGNGQLVHAGTPTTDIEIADFSFAWYATNFYGAGRVT